MKCNGCGIEFPDTYLKYPNCQTPNPYGQARFINPAQKQHPPYKTAIELIREVGRSKLFLPACILTTIAAAITTLASGLDILTLLTTIAVWLFYAESKKDTGPYKMDLISLKMLKIVKTIQLVICWIAVVILTICLPFLGIGIGAIASEPSGAILGGMAIFVTFFIMLCIGLLVLSIFLQNGLRKFYKIAIESAETGQRPQKLPKYAPIIMLVIACIGITTNITLIFAWGPIMGLIMNSGVYTLPFDIFNAITLTFACIAGTASYVAQILFAFILLDAKKLADRSYYPGPEEAFYNKQIYYGNTPSFYAPYYAPVYNQTPPPVYHQPQVTETNESIPNKEQETPAEQTNQTDTNTDNANQ